MHRSRLCVACSNRLEVHGSSSGPASKGNTTTCSVFHANDRIDSCSDAAHPFHGHPSGSAIGSGPFGLRP
eukprot:5803707-Pyramimonas_sp.AAC.1